MDGGLRRGVHCTLAQVDSFLLFEFLVALLRPQDFGRRAAKTPPQVELMLPIVVQSSSPEVPYILNGKQVERLVPFSHPLQQFPRTSSKIFSRNSACGIQHRQPQGLLSL